MPIANVGSVPDVVTNTLIATDWGNAIGAASKGRVVQRFNSVAERDASITAPITGMVCYVLATDTLYNYRQTGGWTAIPQQTQFYARAYRNGGFTLATGSTLPMDVANYDPGLCFNANAGKFTCPLSGIYSVAGAVSVTASAAAQFLVGGLTKNGTLNTNGPIVGSQGGANILTSPFTDLVQCASGDVLAVQIAYNSATLPGTTGSPYTFLAVQYLHP